jgi:hypothetical protein
MLEALEHNNLHADLLGDLLEDLLVDLGLSPDADSTAAMHALGTVQTWWKKPEYALWYVFEAVVLLCLCIRVCRSVSINEIIYLLRLSDYPCLFVLLVLCQSGCGC